MHVTIIGGGIAGLSAAWFLDQQRGQHPGTIDYSLLEAGPRLGGKIQTETVDGFLLEYGPDSFITQKPSALKLCRELGLEEDLYPCNARQSTVYILRKKRLVPLPQGFRLAAPTQLWPFITSPLMSFPGKLRVGLEPFIPGRTSTEDESLADFIQRRLGKEILDRVAGPIMSGIFSTDPERLSMASSFPRFQTLEQKYGSVIRGMIAEKRKHRGASTNGTPPAMFMGLRSGMGTMVNTLADRLKGSVRAGCRVTGIARIGRQYSVACLIDGQPHTIHTDAIIFALPAGISAPLLQNLAPRIASELSGIGYSNTIHAYLGYRASDLAPGTPPPGFGFVAPKSEGRSIRSCTFSSIKFPGRAPDQHVLLRAFLSSELQETMIGRPETEIIEKVRKEFRELLGIDATPILQRVYAYPTSNPQYEVGHQERLARVETLASEIAGLHFTGSSFRGVGIPDIVADAERVALQCLAALPAEASLASV